MSEVLQFIQANQEISAVLTITVCIFLYAVIEKIVDGRSKN